MNLEIFERTVERATGQTTDTVRRTPLTELREQMEKKKGRLIRFKSFFPWIGRGNVMRDRLATREIADAAAEEAIRVLRHSIRAS